MRVFQEWILTPWRLAIHEPTRTAVVADMHLGYDLARRQAGEAVPNIDWDGYLAPLHAAVSTHDIESLVIAGDLFEKAFDPELWRHLRKRLSGMGFSIVAIVPGNHDRGLCEQKKLPIYPDGFMLAKWTILHGHGASQADKTVLGHWHPCVLRRGRKTPCYLVGPRRLVLPAYSHDAAGVNIWRHPEWRGMRCCAIVDGVVIDAGFVPGKSAGTHATNKKSRPWEGRLQRS
ncbi:MAG: metallophosphoesterase [Planctomycetes bacterium]|nr:metallophosphoesterase [Planctomycetota bacterium]